MAARVSGTSKNNTNKGVWMLKGMFDKVMLSVLVLCALAAGAIVTLMRDEGFDLFLMIVTQDLLLLAVGWGFYRILLKRPINKAVDVLSHSSALDLTSRLDATRSGPLQQLCGVVNQFKDYCEQAIADIAASTGRLVPMSKELADGYSSQEQKARMQKLYSQTVASALGKMHEAGAVVYRQVDATNHAISETQARVESCQSVFQDTATSMDKLAAQIDQAAEKVAQLSNRSADIGQIIDVIKEIADQTSLLSLNAAIEAARAGEKGRGFAVVADEIRNLAECTQRSTLEVQEVIEAIQQDTGHVVETMTEGHTLAGRTQRLATESERELSSIEEMVAEISRIASEILQAMEQQKATALESQSAVDALVNLDAEALEDHQSPSVSVEDLVKLGEVLRTKLDKFIVSQDGWDETLRNGRRSNETSTSSVSPGQQSSSEVTFF
ncbi:MAG: hypothetical protein B6D82_18250 [gamma proteobacterium symbiont of Ctena orbiculata]|nr:MAG: hypothetical protein B6D82_18250 [gamma proteobacterium symbiont of Ctena orbiculata]